MNKRTILPLALICCLITANSFAQNKAMYKKGWTDFNKNGRKDIYEDPAQPTEKRVADLLSQMNVNEKTCQLATLYGYGRVLKDSLPTANWKNEIWKDGIANIDEMLNGVDDHPDRIKDLLYPFSNHAQAINTVQRWFVEQTRLGIPVDFTNEGVHGLNHTKATPLPAPIAIGSTWNPDIVYQAGVIEGKEAKALGYTNIYAPILDVSRDPRWGRVLETYGENPHHIAALGTQMTNGIQSQGIGVTLKHFAVYSVPQGGRDGDARTDPHVAPRELHEIFLYPFKTVIENSHPLGVMASYNDWDGEPVIASSFFLTKLLRQQFGFNGYVVSDSRAVDYVYSKHKVAPTYDDGVRQTLEAGMNVCTDFTPPSDFILAARRLIEANKVSMATIDARVAEVLRVKFELGLFDHPYADVNAAKEVKGMDDNINFAKKIQEEAMVLLKNDNNLLPLDKQKTTRILITGPLADESNYMISRYGPNQLNTITVLQGLKDYLKGSNTTIDYVKGCDVINPGWPKTEIVPIPLSDEENAGIAEAVAKARQNDVIIAVLGEDERRTGESKSRTSLDLPGRQEQLLEALQATGKPVILVLINGQPLTINWADAHVPAILEAWFPSALGGQVIAETLFGDNNPGGKLPITFPKTTGQLEMNYPFKKGSHGGQPGVGPNGHGATRVLGEIYPFGHGLSYTTFKYSDLNVTPRQQSTQGTYTVTFNVTNTGSRTGDEVAQLYVRDRVSSVVTYDGDLRGFQRLSLKPGETQKVTFKLTPTDLQLLDKNMNWTVEPGEFDIWVGSSCEDIHLKEVITAVP